MSQRSAVTAIIPCLDEEEAIGPVVTAMTGYGLGEIIVVDGGSQDHTAQRALAAGAKVVIAPQRGYGRALRTGLAAASPLLTDGRGRLAAAGSRSRQR